MSRISVLMRGLQGRPSYPSVIYMPNKKLLQEPMGELRQTGNLLMSWPWICSMLDCLKQFTVVSKFSIWVETRGVWEGRIIGCSKE